MFSSRILKGGALLAESRVLVEHWDKEQHPAGNLGRMVEQNVFAKRTASRTRDVAKVLRPRLVDGHPDVVPALRELLGSPRAFTEACYYEASRADGLLAAFAEQKLYDWYREGRQRISVADVVEWLDDLAMEGAVPKWSDQVRARAAGGLLSATRDFGVLSGAAAKRFATPHVSPAGFAYVAYRQRQAGVAEADLFVSDVWRRWLLSPPMVEQMLAEAGHLGVLRQSRAGSMLRLDWEASSLEEVAARVG